MPQRAQQLPDQAPERVGQRHGKPLDGRAGVGEMRAPGPRIESIPDGSKVYMGLDLAQKKDFAALTLAWEEDVEVSTGTVFDPSRHGGRPCLLQTPIAQSSVSGACARVYYLNELAVQESGNAQPGRCGAPGLRGGDGQGRSPILIAWPTTCVPTVAAFRCAGDRLRPGALVSSLES